VPSLIVPESFALVLAACAPCFTAPTYRLFCHLVAGWQHCPGRHTVTGVALAAGAGVVGWRHISAFHRFFGRATWEPDALGKVVFTLALRWLQAVPAAPIVLLVDDSLARKEGKAIALGSMHHDPLLSTRRRPFSRFGHVWVVLAVWLPLPFGVVGGPRGVAVPVVFRLFVGSKRGNRKDAPSRPTSGTRYTRAQAAFPVAAAQRPSKPDLAREAIALVAGWATALAPERTVYVVGDSAYVNRTTIEHRPANVEVLGPLHPGAALFASPPPRQPGQMGRPRTRGATAFPYGAGTGTPPRDVAPAAGHPLRAHRHATGVPRHRPVVQRAAHGAPALRRGARPQWPAQGRGVLLHQPARQRRLPLGNLRDTVES